MTTEDTDDAGAVATYGSRLPAMGHAGRLSQATGTPHEAVQSQKEPGRWIVRPVPVEMDGSAYQAAAPQQSNIHEAAMAHKEPEYASVAGIAFVAGAAVIAALAWFNWPTKPAASAEPHPPRAIRSLGEFQVSATESVKAIVIPNPDGYTASVCVIYANSELRSSTIVCPEREAIDLNHDSHADEPRP